jgi:hypothetical protein
MRDPLGNSSRFQFRGVANCRRSAFWHASAPYRNSCSDAGYERSDERGQMKLIAEFQGP